MLRVLLVGNYALDKQESMLRFAALMQRELSALGHEVQLLQPPAHLAKILPFGGSIGKWLGYVDKFILFPRTLRSVCGNFDVIHICDHSNAMYSRYLSDMPHVVTCHDVLAIRSALGEIAENVVPFTGRKFQSLILNGLREAQFIVCVSENTEKELLRITNRPAETVGVVYLCLNYPYTPMERDVAIARLSRYSFDATVPFFVHVGNNSWYKNRLGVLEIFKSLTVKTSSPKCLLMIGKPLTEVLLSYISENNLQNQVVTLSGLSNEDLRAAYSMATGLLFPSLQEGFGWPILEAQACGCAVFATNKPPMTEVGGEAAIYFDPKDVEASADVVVAALERLDTVRKNGRSNVSRFGVEQMMAGYTDAFSNVVISRGIGQSACR